MWKALWRSVSSNVVREPDIKDASLELGFEGWGETKWVGRTRRGCVLGQGVMLAVLSGPCPHPHALSVPWWTPSLQPLRFFT